MSDKIIDFIFSKANLNVSEQERETIFQTVKALYNNPLITERNLSTKPADNYNFGNFFINKDKESESSMIMVNENFRKKYFNKTEQEIYDFLKKKNLSNDSIIKFMLLYNTCVGKRIKMNNEIEIKDILDYVID